MADDTASEFLRASDLFSQLVHKTLSQRLVAEISDETITQPQANALRFILLHPNVLMGDFAAGLAITYPSATNMVKRLEALGLAERVSNPVDRREVEIRLTEQGKKLAHAINTARVRRLDELLRRLAPERRVLLMESLREFIVAAVGDSEAIAADVCLRCGEYSSALCPVAGCSALHVCR